MRNDARLLIAARVFNANADLETLDSPTGDCFVARRRAATVGVDATVAVETLAQRLGEAQLIIEHCDKVGRIGHLMGNNAGSIAQVLAYERITIRREVPCVVKMIDAYMVVPVFLPSKTVLPVCAPATRPTSLMLGIGLKEIVLTCAVIVMADAHNSVASKRDGMNFAGIDTGELSACVRNAEYYSGSRKTA